MNRIMKISTIAVVLGLTLSILPAVSGATGNGAPSGAHYNLNLIGIPKNKTADMTGNNGHRIFMPLDGKAKILLTEGDFAVLDANGTDGTAKFQLPNPDVDGDGVTSYSVFVRTLGKPGGKATLQSCYTDATGEWCAVDFADGVMPIELGRSKGKSTFKNVTKDLLFVDYCTAWSDSNGDSVFTSNECTGVNQIALFSDDSLGYLWSYNNNGLKVAQLRFYEVPTTVN